MSFSLIKNKFAYYLLTPLVILSFKYPQVAFIFHFHNREQIKPWFNDYAKVCDWDCGFYSNMTEKFELNSFFPLFPLFLKSLKAIGDFLLLPISFRANALLGSVIFYILAGVALLFLSDVLLKGEAEKQESFLGHDKESWLFLFAVAIFPPTQYWIYGYPEPLFVLLVTLSILFMSRSEWIPSALSAGLASVTRPQGIWILGAFLLVILIKRRHIGSLRKIVLLLIAALVPFSIYLMWNYLDTGNPIHFWEVQKKFSRGFNFGAGLECHIPRFTEDYLKLLIALFASYYFIFRQKGIEWLYLGIVTFLLAELPLYVGGYYSYYRFSGVNIGIIVAVFIFTKRYRWLQLALITWCIIYTAVGVHQWFLHLPIY